jgi:hypothetical protein
LYRPLNFPQSYTRNIYRLSKLEGTFVSFGEQPSTKSTLGLGNIIDMAQLIHYFLHHLQEATLLGPLKILDDRLGQINAAIIFGRLRNLAALGEQLRNLLERYLLPGFREMTRHHERAWLSIHSKCL